MNMGEYRVSDRRHAAPAARSDGVGIALRGLVGVEALRDAGLWCSGRRVMEHAGRTQGGRDPVRAASPSPPPRHGNR